MLAYNATDIFLFKLFDFGKWIDIIIEDRLPYVDNNLVYSLLYQKT